MSARECALEALCRVIDKGAYNNIALSSLYEKYGLSAEDKSLCGNIVKGVLERKLTLDYLISKLSVFPLESLDKRVQNILRMGIYQIMFLDRIPDFAVCNESSILASSLGKKKKGFVNGVLRTLCREKNRYLKELETAPLFVKYSMCEELFQLLLEQYGKDAEKIALSFFEKDSNALRVNTLKITANELLLILEKQGASCEILKDTTIIVNEGFGKILPIVNEGLFYVQGLSSQRAVEVLEAKEGYVVVDVCACPGGKTVGAAMDMKNKGEIFAFDIHENKLPLIHKNAENLGITIIKTEKHNSKIINEKYIGIADRVICDVPCSGIGSIGKRPEIRYKSISDINGLVKTQKEILSSSVGYLKNDGVLVYSVCSINKNEGEYLIKEFLSENSNFCLLHQETVLPTSGCDGFYIGKICKKAVE